MTVAAVTAYIGLGANLDDPQGTVQRAIAALAGLPQTQLSAQSSLFRSAPVDANGDDYVNAVAQLETALSAQHLLEQLQRIEQDFGRERPYHHAPRSLDLDLLLYDNQKLHTATLTVPHPRMTQRAFTLIPLLQINPLITIPGHGPAHRLVAGVAGQVIQKIP